MQHRSRTINRRSLLAATALAMATPIGSRVAAQTPAPAAGDAFADRIEALLAAAPAREFATTVPFYYADLAAQLASVGVERPAPGDAATDLPDGFVEAVLALPLAARAFEVARDPRWYPTFGFSPYTVGQALLLVSEGSVSMFRGGVDADAVRRMLAESGYVEVTSEHGAWFSFGDDIAPETPVGELGLGTMNHAVVTDDLLVFAGQEADIATVLAAMAGAEPAMATQDLWTGLVALFSADVVGMIPVSPSALAPLAAAASPAATPAAASPLVSLAVGVRAGSRAAPLALGGEGTPEATPVGAEAVSARIEARLRYADAATAAHEAEAIPARWRAGSSTITGGSLDDLMELVDSRVSPVESSAVDVDFVADTPNRWSQMIHTGDLAALLPAVG